MGYLFLSVALLAGVTKGYCGKKTSGYVENYSTAIVVNLIRMVLCVLIGGIMIMAEGNAGYIRGGRTLLLISAAAGVSTSVFVVCWLISVKKGAYMMLDVFLMLGVLVPICGGSMLFHENIRLVQGFGIALLILAACVMCSYNNSVKEKLKVSSFILLLVCSISSGITDLMQKIFVELCAGMPVSVFSFYTYVFSAITLCVFWVYFNKKEKKEGKAVELAQIKKMIGYIAVMSGCLFANTLFKTKAAGYLDAVQLYPLSQGGSLILSACMAAVMFGEKLTRKCVAGLLIAFGGLVVLNML